MAKIGEFSVWGLLFVLREVEGFFASTERSRCTGEFKTAFLFCCVTGSGILLGCIGIVYPESIRGTLQLYFFIEL